MAHQNYEDLLESASIHQRDVMQVDENSCRVVLHQRDIRQS